jgi:hypothetical protein
VQPLLDMVLDVALSPVLWLCVLLGLVYGMLFTLWRGGGWRWLARDILVGVAGFGAGQLAASVLGLPTLRVGEVHLFWGTLASVLALLVGRRLLKPRVSPKSTKPGSAKS